MLGFIKGPAAVGPYALLAALLLAVTPVPATAAGEAGMCAGQPPLDESELVSAAAILKELMTLWPRMSPEDEETMVRGHGLTSPRLNCVLGKLMAGNDIFGWGGPEVYGVSLSPEELELVQRYRNDSLILKKHLEENLNIKAEP